MALRIIVTGLILAAVGCGWFSYDYYSKVPNHEQELAAAKEKLKNLGPEKSDERERAEISERNLPPLIETYRNNGQQYAIAGGALVVAAFLLYMFSRKRIDPFDKRIENA